MVFSRSSEAVELVNHHIEKGLDSLQDDKNINDREIIERVLSAIKMLSRLGYPVSISIASREDKTGEMFAKQNGRKVCESRYQLRLTRKIARSEKNSRRDGVAVEGSLKLHHRLMRVNVRDLLVRSKEAGNDLGEAK